MKLSLLIAIFFLCCLPAFAQKEWNIWYFGNRAGLDFNRTPVQPLPGSMMNAIEGCASVSDAKGNLLFYTNGDSVWNQNHVLMTNGDSLGGHPSASQSGLIVPQPGVPNRYYIFSNDAAESIVQSPTYYSVVDMSKSNGLGAVVEKKQFLDPGYNYESAEKLTAIRHANGQDIWVLTHDLGSNNFRAQLLTIFGVTSTVVSFAGIDHSADLYHRAGYMKCSHDGKRIAVAIADSRTVELLYFDNATGKVSGPSVTLPCILLPYGVEFSPDDTKLYVSTGIFPAGGLLMQYDVRSTNENIIRASAVIISSSFDQWYGTVQLGPDGKIYMAIMHNQYLGVVNSPNKPGTDCDFDPEGQHLADKMSNRGLPNFHTAYAPTIAFEKSTTCDSTTFFLLGSAALADSVHWNFGDPASGDANTSTAREPVHRFRIAGRYTVQLTVFHLGQSVTVSGSIVAPNYFSVNLGSDTILCAGSELILDVPNTDIVSYLWSTGEVSESIIIREPGTYWVSASNGQCEATDTIVVTLRAPSLEVSADRTICPGASTQLSASSSGKLTYRWWPENGLSDAHISSPVAQPEITTIYTVTGTDEYGCTTTANVTVTIGTGLSVDLGRDTTICRGGRLELDAENAPGTVYQWSTGETTPTIVVAQAGEYTVVVTSGNCTGTDSIRIELDDFSISVTGNQVLCAGNSVQLWASGAARYEWSPTEGLSDPGAAEPFASPTTTTTYRVVGTSHAGCRDTAFVTVEVLIYRIEVTGAQVICPGGSVQLRASGAARYEWSPTEGISDPGAAEPLASPTTTTTYRVVGTSHAGCRDTAFVLVEVRQSMEVDLGKDTTICAGISIELGTAIPNARYLWSTGETTSSITVRTPGIYKVTVTSGTCTSSDEIAIAFSAPLLSVEASSPQLCNGDTTRLSASGAVVYRWEPTSGLSDPTIAQPLAFPDHTTVYTVTGTDAGGCTTSASITIEVAPPQLLHLSLPAMSAEIGAKNFAIPLLAETDSTILPLSVRDLTLDIHVHSSVFLPEWVSHGSFSYRRSGSEIIMSLALGDVTITEPRQTLAELTGTLMLGDSALTSLRFGAIQHDPCTEIRLHNGSLLLDGCILDSRRIRRFALAKLSVFPNPAVDEAALHMDNITKGTARIEVHSMQGRRMAESAITITGDSEVVSVPLHGIPDGVYRLTLITAGGIHTTILTVVR